MEMALLLLVFICISTLIAALAFLGLIMLYLTSSPTPDLSRARSERSFLHIENENASPIAIPFPTIDDQPSVTLSVIVPAYKEQYRLPKMLDEALAYLEARRKKQDGAGALGDRTSLNSEESALTASSNESLVNNTWSELASPSGEAGAPFTYEVIVVDDGSPAPDRTTDVALGYVRRFGSDRVRVLTGARNRGKGGAIRVGVLAARGRYILFADADGATTFEDVELLEAELKRLARAEMTGMVLVCGSRAHLQSQSVAQRSYFRTLLMYGFHALVLLLGGEHCVKDTQCGFKLMTRAAARILFTNLHVERWAFDVELLYIARRVPRSGSGSGERRAAMAVGEVGVRWEEIAGSKLVPVFSWLQMARDLLFIRLRYALGVWRIDAHLKLE